MLSTPIKIIPGANRMSPLPATEPDAHDRNTAIALFRYGLIAQLVHTPPDSGQQESLLREIAARTYTIPGSSRTRVSLTTLRRYLKTYGSPQIGGGGSVS
jgi:putative transposase